jgi:hypothetical protein
MVQATTYQEKPLRLKGNKQKIQNLGDTIKVSFILLVQRFELELL